MADASPYYAIRNLQIDSASWTPIVTPIDCYSFSMRCNAADVFVRSNSADATTQDTILAGVQEYLLVPWKPWVRTIGWSGCRFPAGTTIVYLKASAGTPNVVLKFVF
jgi:hypothetical protein